MTKRDRLGASVCLSVLIALTAARTGQAQALYGSIIGAVKDSSGEVVAGASVLLTNTVTKQSREAATNDVGGYDFPTITPGTYEIKVSKAGFATSTETGIVVNAENTLRIDLNLKVGAVSESVLVTGEAAQLQTDKSEVRNEVGAVQLSNLPLSLGRNYQTLLEQVPGFSVPQASYNSTPSNPSKALVFNVNGASFSINNTKIDGAQSINVYLPHESAYIPTLESIQDVSVVTNSYDAETGMAGGAAVFVQTKSGTNDLHGVVFEGHDNQHMNAREFFSAVKPKLVDNEFGGALGGRIIKDKLFFFGSYEGTLDHEGTSYLGSVPVAAMKAGDMSGSSNPIYDPNTGDASGAGRTPFPGNLLPTSRISPIAAQLAALTPLPNVPGGALASNYLVIGNYIFDRHRVDGKLNWNPSAKLTMFARYGFLNYSMSNPPAYGALGGPPISTAGGNVGHGSGNTFTAAGGGTYVFSPTFIMDAYYSWTRLGTQIVPPGLGQNLGLALGIPGTNGPSSNQGGYPMFNITGFDIIGTAASYLPYYRTDPASQQVVNFNKVKGQHDIRFGVEISEMAQNHIEVDNTTPYGTQGGFQFAGGPTALNGGPSPNQFNDYADFLLGLPTGVGKNTLNVPVSTSRANQYGLFIRDRWNVTPKLTLNYGMRWEYYPMPTRADQGFGLYNYQTNQVNVCGYGIVPSGCDVKMSKKYFVPRVGFAYRPSTTLVLRAGYGITVDPYGLARPLITNYPIVTIQQYNGVNSYQAYDTLAHGIPATVPPNLGNGILSFPGSFPIYTTPVSQFKRGYIQSWNFTVQKQVWGGFTVQAAYVATRSTDQDAYLDMNAGQTLGAGTAGQPLNQLFGRTAITYLLTPLGTSQYNALQAQLQRRFARGLQFSANYTWSKAVGWTAGGNDDQTPQVNDMAYFGLNRSVLSYDRTQNLQLSGVWELPFGKGKPWVSGGGPASAILGGWQFNGLAAVLSGLPFSVSASATSMNAPDNIQRANQILPNVQILGGVGAGQPYFNPLAFAPVTTASFGNAGFYSMRGPGVFNTDLSIFREFAWKEQVKIQFRAEAFNATNHPDFSVPSANVSNLVLNSNGTVKSLGGYDTITSVVNLGRDFGSRRFRLGLRISF